MRQQHNLVFQMGNERHGMASVLEHFEDAGPVHFDQIAQVLPCVNRKPADRLATLPRRIIQKSHWLELRTLQLPQKCHLA
jgi:hypothetical protein